MTGKKWYIILCTLVMGWNSGKAQSTKDTAYIESFSHRLIISTRFFAKDYQINLQPIAGRTLRFQNANLNTGIRIKYKKLGVSFSLPVRALHAPAGSKAKHLGVALNFYEPRFFLRAGVRRFEGFTQIDPPSDLYRSDMRMWHGLVRGFYVFNYPRYSLRSTFKLSERQKQSQGSWLAGGLLSNQHLRADSLIIPVLENTKHSLKGYESFKLGIGGGYAHTIINNKWFLTLVATGGMEFRYIRFVGQEVVDTQSRWRISPRINAQAGCGYNGNRFFVALNGFYLPGADFTEALNVRVEDTQINLVFGWRFQNADTFDVEE